MPAMDQAIEIIRASALAEAEATSRATSGLERAAWAPAVPLASLLVGASERLVRVYAKQPSTMRSRAAQSSLLSSLSAQLRNESVSFTQAAMERFTSITSALAAAENAHDPVNATATAGYLSAAVDAALMAKRLHAAMCDVRQSVEAAAMSSGAFAAAQTGVAHAIQAQRPVHEVEALHRVLQEATLAHEAAVSKAHDAERVAEAARVEAERGSDLESVLMSASADARTARASRRIVRADAQRAAEERDDEGRRFDAIRDDENASLAALPPLIAGAGAKVEVLEREARAALEQLHRAVRARRTMVLAQERYGARQRSNHSAFDLFDRASAVQLEQLRQAESVLAIDEQLAADAEIFIADAQRIALAAADEVNFMSTHYVACEIARLEADKQLALLRGDFSAAKRCETRTEALHAQLDCVIHGGECALRPRVALLPSAARKQMRRDVDALRWGEERRPPPPTTPLPSDYVAFVRPPTPGEPRIKSDDVIISVSGVAALPSLIPRLSVAAELAQLPSQTTRKVRAQHASFSSPRSPTPDMGVVGGIEKSHRPHPSGRQHFTLPILPSLLPDESGVGDASANEFGALVKRLEAQARELGSIEATYNEMRLILGLLDQHAHGLDRGSWVTVLDSYARGLPEVWRGEVSKESLSTLFSAIDRNGKGIAYTMEAECALVVLLKIPPVRAAKFVFAACSRGTRSVNSSLAFCPHLCFCTHIVVRSHVFIQRAVRSISTSSSSRSVQWLRLRCICDMVRRVRSHGRIKS